MEMQETTKIVRRKANVLANRDLANIVVFGAGFCRTDGALAIGRLSPQLETVERERAEKAARQEAVRKAKEAAKMRRVEEARQRKEAIREAKKAAAVRRAEENWQSKEAARISREMQPVREVHGD